MSHVTETWKAHQMNVNVERNLFAKFHKDGGEECFGLEIKIHRIRGWVKKP